MIDIQRRNGGKDFYVVKDVIKNGKRTKETVRKSSKEEYNSFHAAKNGLENMDLTAISCAFPECDMLRPIPREQKRLLKTVLPQRYKQFTDIYCSQKCRNAHEQDLKTVLKE